MKKILFSLFALAWLYPAAGQDIPVSADATFIPRNLAYFTHIDGAILQKIGCKYIIPDSATASQLQTLLIAARDVPQDSLDPNQHFEARNKVVFHFQHKQDVSVEFSQQFLNLPYLKANWNAQPTLLRKTVFDEVREVISRGGFTQMNPNASTSCDSL